MIAQRTHTVSKLPVGSERRALCMKRQKRSMSATRSQGEAHRLRVGLRPECAPGAGERRQSRNTDVRLNPTRFAIRHMR